MDVCKTVPSIGNVHWNIMIVWSSVFIFFQFQIFNIVFFNQTEFINISTLSLEFILLKWKLFRDILLFIHTNFRFSETNLIILLFGHRHYIKLKSWSVISLLTAKQQASKFLIMIQNLHCSCSFPGLYFYR